MSDIITLFVNGSRIALNHFVQQDLLHCLFLAEGTYKVIDHGPEVATELTSRLVEGFPCDLVSLQELSWTLPHVNHRCIIAVKIVWNWL